VLILGLGACGDNLAASPPHADAGPSIDAGDAGVVGAGDAGSGSGADATPPPDLVAMCGAVPTTLGEWEDCYLKRFCETMFDCGYMNLYNSVQECIDLSNALSGGQLAFEGREHTRAIAAKRASINKDAFTQCLIELDPKRCVNPEFSFSCATRFAGTIPDNQGCYDDIECKSPGASCSFQSCSDACCLGVCQPRLKEGDRCLTLSDCEPGLMCSLDQYCVSGSVNSHCTNPADCDPTTWCDRLAGICKPAFSEDAPCSLMTQCMGETSCVGLHRKVEPARCRRVNVEGDACDYFCLGNLYCDLSNPDGFGVCRPLPGPGGGCGTFLPCVGRNEVCEQGTCVTKPDVDQPCFEGTCLPGLFCTDQLDPTNPTPTCKRPLMDGQDGCNQPDQCQSYICNATTSKCQSWSDTCPL
jgi:hypothetical protein